MFSWNMGLVEQAWQVSHLLQLFAVGLLRSLFFLALVTGIESRTSERIYTFVDLFRVGVLSTDDGGGGFWAEELQRAGIPKRDPLVPTKGLSGLRAVLCAWVV